MRALAHVPTNDDGVSYDSEHYVCHVAGYYPWSHNNTKPWYRFMQSRMSLPFNDRLLSVQWRYAYTNDTGARYYFMHDNSIAIYFCGKLASVNVRIKITYPEATERCIARSCRKRILPIQKYDCSWYNTFSRE